MQTMMVRAVIPSWEGAKEDDKSSAPSFSVVLMGAAESVDGSTRIKKNSAPTHSNDYDVCCNSEGELSGEPLLNDVTKVYIWGYGYTLDGSFYDCESIYNNATEIELSNDMEIVLWGANSV